MYDPEAMAWSKVLFKADGVEGPEARSVTALLPVMALDGRRLLVTLFGEHDPLSLGHAGAGKILGDVWAFDVETQTWSEVKATGVERGVLPPRGWFDADILK